MLKPLGSRLLISPLEDSKKDGLLSIADTRKNVRIGSVIEVGDEVKGISIGDEVVYPAICFEEYVSDDGQSFHVVSGEDVWGKSFDKSLPVKEK